ncbi:MAG: Rpn family recombination-promoting nuclease/putative transposase [Saprospiraceae bacterium]|nr:Rpn family recombination-promoting nuclease/putative transposase [Saprospiraceae bacterium]
MPKEINIFDQIFKEYAEPIFLPFIERLLGQKIIKKESLKDKIQTSIERECDFLFEITLENSEHFILHIEFQSQDDPTMLQRMAEYHGIIFKKYQMEIKHYLIYLGERPTKMPSKLEDRFVFKEYQLINLSETDPETYLQSNIPEEFILAVLSRYPKEQYEGILRSIVNKLFTVVKNKPLLEKYTKQLIFISRLRKLELQTTKILEIMPIMIDIESDGLYLKGISQGLSQGLSQGISQAKVEIVIKGFKNGISIDLLSKISGLSTEEISTLLKTNNLL